MSQRQLTLLYDGACPFCRREIDWMRRRNRQLHLGFEDISASNFRAEDYGLSRAEVQRVMHALRADGSVVRGLDALCEAYAALGYGWLVAPLQWPGVHAAAAAGYAAFARVRVPLGRLFGRRGESRTCCHLD